MHKFSIQLIDFSWLFILLFVSISFLVFRFYHKTRPKMSVRILWILIGIRSLVFCILFLLLMGPILIIYYWENVETKSVIVIDNSGSMKEHRKRVDSIKSTILTRFPNANIVYTNSENQTEKTDIIAALSGIKTQSTMPIFLISDANQTVDFIPPANLPESLKIIPVGKKMPLDDFQLNVLNYSPIISQVGELNQLTLQLSHRETQLFDVQIEINKFTFQKQIKSSANYLLKPLIENPNRYSNDSVFQIKIRATNQFKKSKILNKRIRIKRQHRYFLHIFQSPSPEQAFIKNSISEALDLELISKPIEQFKFSDMKNKDIRILLLSASANRHSSIKSDSLIEWAIKGKMAILYHLDIADYAAQLSKMTIEKEIRKDKNYIFRQSNLPFLSQIALESITIDNFALPELSYYSFKLELPQSLQLIQNLQNEAILSVFRRNATKVAVLGSQNLWQLNRILSIEGSPPYFKHLLIHLANYLQADSHVFEIKDVPNNIDALTQANFNMSLKPEFRESYQFDRIDIQLFNQNQRIHFQSMDYNQDNFYPFKLQVPDSGTLQIQVQTIIKQEIDLSERFYIQINSLNKEYFNTFINNDFIEFLKEEAFSEVIEPENLTGFLNETKNESKMLLKNKTIELNQAPYLLYVILFFLIIEWYLRKTYKLY